MEFEKCYRGEIGYTEVWEEASHAEIQQECTEKEINMMIFHKAVILKVGVKYRRKINPDLIDWAKK